MSQREREAGRYSPSAYALAETLAAAPFVLLLALASALPLYYTAGLAPGPDRLLYFILALFLALFAADSLMAALCVLAPHFLMGLMGGRQGGCCAWAQQMTAAVACSWLHAGSASWCPLLAFIIPQAGGVYLVLAHIVAEIATMCGRPTE